MFPISSEMQVYLFAGSLLLVFSGASIAIARARKQGRSNQSVEGIVISFAIVLFIVFVFLHFQVRTGILRDEFNALADQNIGMLVIDDEVTIQDEHVIQSLITTVRDAKGVAGHHSHSVRHISLNFPAQRKRYRLGRDSTTPSEYWLFEVTDEGIEQLRQFASPQLDAWLNTHAFGK